MGQCSSNQNFATENPTAPFEFVKLDRMKERGVMSRPGKVRESPTKSTTDEQERNEYEPKNTEGTRTLRL